MGEPGPDKVTLIQGKDLGLVLETPERRADDNTVIVFFILRAKIRAAVFMEAADPVRTG